MDARHAVARDFGTRLWYANAAVAWRPWREHICIQARILPLQRKVDTGVISSASCRDAKLHHSIHGMSLVHYPGLRPWRHMCRQHVLIDSVRFRRFSLCTQLPLWDRSHMISFPPPPRGKAWRGDPGVQESGMIASTDLTNLAVHSRSTSEPVASQMARS